MALTYYVATKDSKIYQINNVTAVTVATPLVSNGTFRDAPPIVVGGASFSGISGASAVELSVSGGSTQTINAGAFAPSADITAPSSVVQDDSFTHVAPRYLNSPLGLVFFTTTAAIAPTPTGASFSTTPPTVPGGNFSVVNADCFFVLEEVVGVTNCPPQGWTPTATA